MYPFRISPFQFPVAQTAPSFLLESITPVPRQPRFLNLNADSWTKGRQLIQLGTSIFLTVSSKVGTDQKETSLSL